MMSIDHRVLLIRIPRAYRLGMSDQALYEATRKWWRIGSRRDRADYAFAVAGGVVRAAYRIDEWQQEQGSGRWAFTGTPDPRLAERYIGMDVSDHFRPGAQNPIRYVNC